MRNKSKRRFESLNDFSTIVPLLMLAKCGFWVEGFHFVLLITYPNFIIQALNDGGSRGA
jgi:hypothetical protein